MNYLERPSSNGNNAAAATTAAQVFLFGTVALCHTYLCTRDYRLAAAAASASSDDSDPPVNEEVDSATSKAREVAQPEGEGVKPVDDDESIKHASASSTTTNSRGTNLVLLRLFVAEPKLHVFELLQLEVDPHRAVIDDILAEIAATATEKPLREQEYGEICLADGTEVEPFMLLESCVHGEDTFAIAVPSHYSAVAMKRYAASVIRDPKLEKMFQEFVDIDQFDPEPWIELPSLGGLGDSNRTVIISNRRSDTNDGDAGSHCSDVSSLSPSATSSPVKNKPSSGTWAGLLADEYIAAGKSSQGAAGGGDDDNASRCSEVSSLAPSAATTSSIATPVKKEGLTEASDTYAGKEKANDDASPGGRFRSEVIPSLPPLSSSSSNSTTSPVVKNKSSFEAAGGLVETTTTSDESTSTTSESSSSTHDWEEKNAMEDWSGSDPSVNNKGKGSTNSEGGPMSKNASSRGSPSTSSQPKVEQQRGEDVLTEKKKKTSSSIITTTTNRKGGTSDMMTPPRKKKSKKKGSKQSDKSDHSPLKNLKRMLKKKVPFGRAA